MIGQLVRRIVGPVLRNGENRLGLYVFLVMEKVVHFTVTGKFLTQHARQLWADENEPARAVDLLLNGLIGIEMTHVIDILTGRSKLEGDSTKGIDLVGDGSTLSPCGQPLPTLIEVLNRSKQETIQAKRRGDDLLKLENNEGVTMASPKGLVMVSKQTRDEIGKGKIEWEDVWTNRVYRQLTLFEEAYVKHTVKPKASLFLNEEDEPELPPPIFHSKIVTDTGWLSPDGRFYPCGWREHIYLADRISRHLNPEESEPVIGGWEHRLEQRGWIKFSGRDGIFKLDQPATKRQNDRILEWCLGEGKGLTELPYWLEPGWED
jgi:hypothetical protein